ncbi:MAG TPA: sigma factor-like helix-turn-helix DNA-binding protein [Pseudogracilibacillus sp.]|nr:sigma factor-like helix-turn-helix DNA-binding protein [Pseudogracilibacillus sp.]
MVAEMWADTLITEYEEGRRDLNRMREELGTTERDLSDKTLINGMISDMTFSLNWLKIGKEPGALRGNDRRSVYQHQVYMDMDLFPSLELQPKEELPDDEKKAIIDILMILSARERQCYVLYNAYALTMREIGEELKVSEDTVRTYLNRADKKINKKLVTVL